MMAPSMLITAGRGQSLSLWGSKGGIGQEVVVRFSLEGTARGD
jgi:hypothetical protein